MDGCSNQSSTLGVTDAAAADLVALRDWLEVLPVSSQSDFINQFVPWAFSTLNEKVPVSTEGPGFVYRNALIGCMRGLPAYTEALRPYIDEVIRCTLRIMAEDVDENAAEAMQLYIDMNKAYRAAVEQYVPPFLDFILEMASRFDQLAKRVLDSAKTEEPFRIGAAPHRLVRNSFRLLHDAPVMIVLVFQLHRRFINEYIPRYVPIIVKLLQFDVDRPCGGQPELSSLNEVGGEPQSPQRAIFNDFIACQIKVLSFLAYIARGFSSTLREFREVIPQIILRLLNRCPPEGAPARKELLVAIRHVLSTELRQAFIPHIETMMNENLLLGDGYTAFYIFRPAAYSMLADLIHHVRMELSAEVIDKVIAMYSRALHDPTLPSGIHTMSIKLLLNLIDIIVSERFPADLRRPFLMKIFTTVAFKFEWLRKIIADLLLIRRRSVVDAGNVMPYLPSSFMTASNAQGTATLDEKQYDPYFDDPLNARPISTDNLALDQGRDNIRDLKLHLKTLINGMKNLVLALRTVPIQVAPVKNSAASMLATAPTAAMTPTPSTSAAASATGSTGTTPSSASQLASLPISSVGLTAEEAEKFMVPLFRDGIGCFDIFHFKFNVETGEPSGVAAISAAVTAAALHNDGQGGTSSATAASNAAPVNSQTTIPADEKDMMDQFAYVFSLMDPPIFHDVISANMDFLIEQAKTNIALVSIPQYFLAIAGISKGFATILARHLMDHFEEIGMANPVAGAIILRLFKLLFLAVSVYPEENESVLQPHLAEIILSCFRLYPRASTPANYFILLRSLFRSIGGGRFDSLYKEVLPLLQTILDELSHLSPSTNDPTLRDMYVELCLTTPVRLSNLLPYLSYLMKPVLLALQSTGDLVNQGLRTFELCLDNLTPDFLEPILAPVFPDLLACLWRMLRPPPANQLHAHTAVRLLGKLGGKARRHLITSPAYNFRKNPGAGVVMQLMFEVPLSRTITIACDSIARAAMIILNSSGKDLETRSMALSFLKRTIASILQTHGISDSLESIQERVAILYKSTKGTFSDEAGGSFSTVKKLYSLNALTEKDLKEQCYSMARGLNATHLANSHATAQGDAQPVITADASKQLLCEIVCSLIDAYSLPGVNLTLKEEIHSLLLPLFRFLSILYMTRMEHPIVSCFDFEVLSDIVVEYGTSQNETQVILAWEIVRVIHEQYMLCVPDKETQFEIKTFFLVADKIIAACFRTNALQRVAACRLISRICDLDLSVRFFWHHEIRLIRGILYVMKSLPQGMSGKFSEELTGVVFKILRLGSRMDEAGSALTFPGSATGGQGSNEEFLNHRRQYFDQVMLALVTELSNPNEIVRDAVKASFQLLSDIQGCEVTDLLLPLKSRVYGPIFSKPLRALPMHVQVGYIDAITYCISLRPPLLEINEELLRLINEAITVVESEDQPVTAVRVNNPCGLQTLKIVCIKLLSTCLSGVEFQQQPKLHPLRNQIVAVFFKTLYARQTELMEVARAALEQVMAQQHKLPTELLQNGLRPVLQSLGEPRHLTLAAVEGLRRILQLFSHFFKAEIGRKLLDHLHSWADQHNAASGNSMNPHPSTDVTSGQLNTPSTNFMAASSDVKVVTTIMDLFCLLPSCGQMFVGELTLTVLQLESALKKRASSPFRLVLLKFMELYPVDAVNYLLENFESGSIVDLYVALLSLPGSNKLLIESGRCFEAIQRSFSTVPSKVAPEILRSYLSMIKVYYARCASSLKGSAIDEHVSFIEQIWDYLGTLKMKTSTSTPLPPSAMENLVAKLTFDISLTFLAAHPNHFRIPFLLIRVCVLPYVFDTADLSSQLRAWLKRCTAERLKAMMLMWLDYFIKPETPFVYKARSTRMIVLPMVAELLKLSDAEADMIMDEDMFSRIENAIWHRDCRSCMNGSCVIAVEELQFTFSLMQAMRVRWKSRVLQYQQRIFTFLFNRIQSLDCSVKYSALYTLATCLIESNAPAEQILRTFSSLLRAPSADIRSVLKQAFDMLLPYFVKQGDSIRQEAVKLVTRALTRDGYLLTLVISLWQGIHGHTNELVPLAPALMIPLVYSFSRCGAMAFATADSRATPIDLATTLFEWHSVLGANSPLTSVPHLIDLLLNGLIRLLTSLPDYSEHQMPLFNRGLALLGKFLRAFYGGSYLLKLATTERLLMADPAEEGNHAMISSGMRLLETCIALRANHLVPSDVAQYERVVRSLIDRVGHGRLLAPLKSLFTTIFSKIHDDDMLPRPVEDFKENLQSTLFDGLSTGRNLSVSFTLLAADTVGALAQDVITPAYLRAFSKAVKDHLTIQEGGVPLATSAPTLAGLGAPMGGAATSGTNTLNPNVPLSTMGGSSEAGKQMEISLIQFIILPAIEYGLSQLEKHSDFPRAQYLSALQLLWEQSASIDIQAKLMDIVLNWVKKDNASSVPTLRERVEFLLTSCKVEQMPGESRLLGAYLDIVYEVYSRSAYARTELRSRLEGAFLRGLRSDIPDRKEHFAALLDANIPCNLLSRLRHVFETQRWELTGSSYWIPLALDIILRSAHDVSPSKTLSHMGQLAGELGPASPTIASIYQVLGGGESGNNLQEASGMGKHISVALNIASLAALNDAAAHAFWVQLFSALWGIIAEDTKKFLTGRLIRILSNDDFLCQARGRPSVMESVIEAISMCPSPQPAIPSFLIAYAIKTYGCWYGGARYLETQFEQLPVDVYPADAPTRESAWTELVTVLGKIYGAMGENDYMFGTHRRGFLLGETNVALSFDQIEMVGMAQKLLEEAMSRCRSGTVPFSEAEFSIWEDRWVSSAKSLQQWDLLTELSKSDSNPELGLECLWRLADWGVSETHLAASSLLKAAAVPTARSKFFEAFLALTPVSGIQREQSERVSTFQHAIEEAIQLALHDWLSLPSQQCPAHAQLLHIFQMLVEIQESVVLYSNLSTGATSVLGRPQFLADLKGLLTAWRERLPNPWDDMQMWSDILAWRQHVFSAMNSAFAPLINTAAGSEGNSSTSGVASSSATQAATSGTGAGAGGSSSSHPFAFRGYHEMAWLINRFAHAARKNGLIDVCLSFLNRIYTLPNIEIQDAFLKLREQAKCYMASPADLPTALEVVNATNLNYFSGLQKGEFFALRSIILSRLGLLEEANRVFAQAVQIDLNMGHGWAAWGRFNDQRFSQSQDINYALNAINCYLQAATLFKAHKSRRFLARILWLLTFEDAVGSLGKSFEMYNHDLPTWFWVSFVPQLLASLSRQEQRQARFLLMKIAKNYPQALYLPLRTFHEDCRLVYGSRVLGHRALSVSEASNLAAQTAATTANGKPPTASGGGVTDGASPQITTALNPMPNAGASGAPLSQEVPSGNGSNTNGSNAQTEAISHAPGASPGAAQAAGTIMGPTTAATLRKHPVEAAEELLSILKTGYPLLALTMENVMEHIVHRMRSTVDEDFYRVLTSLIGEAYQLIMSLSNSTAVRSPDGTGRSPSVGSMMEPSLRRVYSMVCNSTSLGPLYKQEFEADFLLPAVIPTLDANIVVEKLFLWRAKLEPSLKRHPKQLVLDGLSRFLAEFEYHRYDDIDVPGQYLQMRDGNQDFVKIDKFDAQVPVVRRHGTAYRRLIIRGSDGAIYPFAVQNPSGRQTRREERIFQLFRFLDVALRRGILARRRGLNFNVPAVVPISAHVRLLADDSSFVNFEEVLNRYCEANGVDSCDEIFLNFKSQLQAALPLISPENPKVNVELLNIRTEIFSNIISSIVPGNILSNVCSLSGFYLHLLIPILSLSFSTWIELSLWPRINGFSAATSLAKPER